MMNTPKNVQIPYEVFCELLELFDYLDISHYSEDFKMRLDIVQDALKDKEKAIKRREVYAAFKTSQGNERDINRIKYMQMKNK